VRVNVKDVPFLVDRLKIQVLPCIVSFVNGITVDRYGGVPAPFVRQAGRSDVHGGAVKKLVARTVRRVVGFTDLGNTDNWPTELLEKRLRNVGTWGRPATRHPGGDARRGLTPRAM